MPRARNLSLNRSCNWVVEMELKFDNEIDAILRGVAKEPNTANSPTEHPDADLISAFAENVLTGDVRMRAMSHFADCNRCRMILTNIVKLNSEFEEETAHAVATPIIETKKVSWFEKLFTVPNLAYTFGALTLVFIGIIGLTFFQNKNSEVARLDENKPAMSKGVSGTSSDGNEVAKENYSANSNSVASNSAANSAPTSNATANSVSNPTMPAANVSSQTNSTSIGSRDAVANKSASNVSLDAKQPVSQPAGRIEEKQDKTPAITIDGTETSATPIPYAPPKPSNEVAIEDSAKNKNIKTEADDEDEKPATVRGGGVLKSKKDEVTSTATGAALAKPQEQKESSLNRKTVAGKTFSNVGGVWTDSAYTGGSTKKVKRSSDDYKKLDQGLQNIGNNLGGTVIVVWNGKAYKIQ